MGQVLHRSHDTHLILVELAVDVLLFALVLEGNDDETDEDVDHEERNDDDVDEEEDGDGRAVVVHRAHLLGVRVYRPVHQTANITHHIESSVSQSCAFMGPVGLWGFWVSVLIMAQQWSIHVEYSSIYFN